MTGRAFAVIIVVSLTMSNPPVVSQTGPQANPDLVVFTSHATDITRIEFDRSGRYMLSADSDHLAIVWDVAAARPMRTLSGVRAPGRVQADGSFMATVRGEATRVAPDGSDVVIPPMTKPTFAVCESELSYDATWTRYKGCDGEMAFASRQSATVWVVPGNHSVSRPFQCGNFVAGMTEDNRIMTLDVAAQTVRTTPRTFGARQVTGMMPFKGTCVEEVRDKTPARVTLLDAATDAVQWQHAVDSREDFAFDPTATYFATVSISGVGEARFTVARVSDGSVVGSGPLNVDFVGRVAISPDGGTLGVSMMGGDVRFVNVKSGHMTVPAVLHPVSIDRIAFRPTDIGLITYQLNGRGHIWNLELGYPGAVLTAPDGRIAHSDSGFVIAILADEGITVFRTGGQEWTQKIPSGASVSALAVSNDARHLAWVQSTSSMNSELRINDSGVVCEQEYTKIKFAMSPDGRWVITDCGSSLHEFKLYDVAAHRFTSTSVQNSRQQPVFDESSSYVLTSEGTGACVRSLPLLAEQGCIPVPETESIVAMAYSRNNDRDQVGLTTDQDRLRVFERNGASFRAVSTVRVASDSARVVAFNRTGVLATGGSDGVVRLWATRDGRLLATAMVAGERDWLTDNRWRSGAKDWVVVAPDGRFDAGGSGIDWMAWHRPQSTDVYELDQFFTEFYTPGLLGMILRGEPPPPASALNIVTELRQPGLRSLVAQRSARIIRANGRTTLCLDDAPDTIRGFRDGSPETWEKNDFTQNPDQPDCRWSRTWPVSVPLEVLKAVGLSEPQSFKTPWDGTRPPLSTGSKLRVITIGIDKYVRPLTGLDDLPAVAKSVSALRQLFARQRAVQHTYGEIILYPEPSDRTRQGILDYLESALREADEDDVVFLYLAGHGWSPPGQSLFYLVPTKGETGSLEAVRRTAISSLDLAEYIRPLKARRLILAVDACQSAAAFGTLTRIADAQIQLQESRARFRSTDPKAPSNGLGLYLLASASPIKVTQMPTAGPSLLAQALIDGWTRHGPDGQSTIRGLVTYVQNAAQAWPLEQRPVVSSLGFDFEIDRQ